MSLFSEAGNQENGFRVILDGTSLIVTEHELGDNQIYRVVFPDQRKPLVITQAMIGSKRAFWTSIPQGRQQEAEMIGELILNHFKK